MPQDFEMFTKPGVSNPLNMATSLHSDHFGQMPLPWRKKEHRFDPEFFKCDNKIVKYNISQLSDWRAIVSFSHTIISEGKTWIHLSGLTVLCFITAAIVFASGSYRSIVDTHSVSSRIQTLISFVFSAYITLTISRWDRIRNTTLGSIWGALENLNFMACKLINTRIKQRKSDKSFSEEEKENFEVNGKEIVSDLVRYSRLIMILTFRAAQGSDDYDLIHEHNLVTIEEEYLLKHALIGTRPLVVVSWISQLFEDNMKKKGYSMSEFEESNILTQLLNLRGGIGATLGCIGSQLPYAYVHVIYWTIQVLLAALAIETGVVLATNIYFMRNGDGEYSPPNDDDKWPKNTYTWYANIFLQITACNITFALFCEGMLSICDKLSNPLSSSDFGLSERLFDTFLYNNCRALYVGMFDYWRINSKDQVEA